MARKGYYKYGPPNPCIPETREVWYPPDSEDGIRIGTMSNQYLGDVLNSLRDSAYVNRSLKLASMITVIPDDGKRCEQELPEEFYWVVNSTWRDFLPTLFRPMELEAMRRGLQWNDIHPLEEKKRAIELDQRVAKFITEGKAAIASKVKRKLRTRVKRQIE